MRFARIAFIGAGIWGIVVLTPGPAQPGAHFRGGRDGRRARSAARPPLHRRVREDAG